MATLTNYGQSFFDRIREGAKSSARALVPVLLDALDQGLPPTDQSMIDVGGGEGWWALEFDKHGFDSWVVEGPGTPVVAEVGTVRRDLEKSIFPLPEFQGRLPFGLALCLETAEHLSPERARGLICDLTTLSDVVVFSAAIPGQRGVHHVNEQWPEYWVDKFALFGYACSGALRWRIWNDRRIAPWYRQNLIIAARRPEELPDLFNVETTRVFPLVHPEKWLELVGARP